MGKKRFSLGKTERLKSRKKIEMLFRQGLSFSSTPFKVFYILEGSQQVDKKPETKKVESPLQMGIGAGKKHLKTAVARNRIKRLTREAFRLQKQELSRFLEEKNLNISVFLVYTGTDLADFMYIQNSIGKVMRTLQIRISEKVTKNT
jgi:ribonuclease P protein component